MERTKQAFFKKFIKKPLINESISKLPLPKNKISSLWTAIAKKLDLLKTMDSTWNR